MCLRSLSFADVLCKSRFNEFLQCWFVVASFALFSQQRTETSRFLEAPRLYTYQTKQTRNSRPQTRFVCRLVCAYQSVGVSYYACYVFPHRFLPTNFRVHPNLPNLQILISYCELLSQEGSGRVCAKSCPFHGKTETLWAFLGLGAVPTFLTWFIGSCSPRQILTRLNRIFLKVVCVGCILHHKTGGKAQKHKFWIPTTDIKLKKYSWNKIRVSSVFFVVRENREAS